MPTIRELSDGYRFFFFSFDCNEPIHIHVSRENKSCKFWIDSVSLAENYGFSSRELNILYRSIAENRNLIRRKWYEHCGET